MQSPNVLARYGAVQVSTGSPGQILLMLYDGLFRFLAEARTALAEKRRGRAGELVGKAHAILDTLHSTLEPVHAPELCANLEQVYGFAMERVLLANIEGKPEAIDDVMRVLAPLRDGWRQVIQKPEVQP